MVDYFLANAFSSEKHNELMKSKTELEVSLAECEKELGPGNNNVLQVLNKFQQDQANANKRIEDGELTLKKLRYSREAALHARAQLQQTITDAQSTLHFNVMKCTKMKEELSKAERDCRTCEHELKSVNESFKKNETSVSELRAAESKWTNTIADAKKALSKLLIDESRFTEGLSKEQMNARQLQVKLNVIKLVLSTYAERCKLEQPVTVVQNIRYPPAVVAVVPVAVEVPQPVVMDVVPVQPVEPTPVITAIEPVVVIAPPVVPVEVQPPVEEVKQPSAKKSKRSSS